MNYEFSDDEICNSDEDYSFNIEADLIKEAWMRFRPKTGRNKEIPSAFNSPEKSSISSKSDLSQTNNNLHNFSKALSNKNKRKTFLERFPLDEVERTILEEEKKLVEEFLGKFKSDNSKRGFIDLAKVLKALPKKFGYENVVKSDIINMRNMKLSLVAYQNESQDKLFQFYDARMKSRLIALAKRAEENKDLIQDIKKYSNSILSRVSRMVNGKESSKKKIPFNVNTVSEYDSYNTSN